MANWISFHVLLGMKLKGRRCLRLSFPSYDWFWFSIAWMLFDGKRTVWQLLLVNSILLLGSLNIRRLVSCTIRSIVHINVLNPFINWLDQIWFLLATDSMQPAFNRLIHSYIYLWYILEIWLWWQWRCSLVRLILH